MAKEKTPASKSNGSSLDFEAQLWAAADKMRGQMDASYIFDRPQTKLLSSELRVPKLPN
jgi:hypothetical protein